MIAAVRDVMSEQRLEVKCMPAVNRGFLYESPAVLTSGVLATRLSLS